MGSLSLLYLIKGCSSGGRKRTRGVRIQKRGDEALGIAFLLEGGYLYQGCIGNKILKDIIVSLKKKKVS